MGDIMTGIYKIENKINGKIYIGQSVWIEKRWVTHKNTATNKYSQSYNYPLYKAIRKYGLDNFIFAVIEECEIYNLNQREIYWIDFYKSYDKNFGYNLTMGGNHSHPIALTFDEVEEIIKLLAETSLTQEEISNLYNISQRTVSSINNGETWKRENVVYPIRNENKINKINTCPSCGKIISKESSHCKQCSSFSQRKVERPNRETLKNEIRNCSFLSLSKKYNVSDNAIRKWCEKYNLPYKKSIIKTISNEDWDKI